MPIPLIVVGLAGLGAGFFVGRGTEGIGNAVKWTVIGAGLYLIGRHVKAW